MISQFISRLQSCIYYLFKKPYFGFIYGHISITQSQLVEIERLIGVDNKSVVTTYEEQFAKLIGDGEAISYAAARMGFYALMRFIRIGKGDEVVLLGSTCSVMVNAIIRTGAYPIYSDMDRNTMGSDVKSIARVITSRTRMIVAQHSFGIPCDIESISILAKKHDIFLLEDCALTIGSKINGVVVGNFGDAALFSTDHSKPLNTLMGGIIYTRSHDLAKELKNASENYFQLSYSRQKAIWRRFLLERALCNPDNYGYLRLLDAYLNFKKKLFNSKRDFLSDDSGVSTLNNYPYPAKLPTFLALIGILEVQKWSAESKERSIVLRKLLDIFEKNNVSHLLPDAYKDKSLEIIPLRLVWFNPDSSKLKSSLQKFIDVSQFWFVEPIISTNLDLKVLGYKEGSCPISEHVGHNIMNIPCNFGISNADKLLILVDEWINQAH